MDLSLFNTADSSEAGSWMPVLDFDYQTPIGCAILVLGPDSHKALVIADEESRFVQKRMADAFSGAKIAKVEEDQDTIVSKDIRKAIAVTKDWREMEWNGQPFPFNPENALILYTKVPHVREQVLRYYKEVTNFTTPEYASWRKRFGKNTSSTLPEKAE